MKKRNNSFKNTLRGFSSLLLAIIAFSVFAPYSKAFAMTFAIGLALLPYMPMPAGILGNLTLTEEQKKLKEQLFEDIKKQIEDNTGTKLDELIAKNDKFKQAIALGDKVKALEDASAKGMKPEEIETLKKEVSELALKLKAIQEKPNDSPEGYKTMKEALTKAFEEQKDVLANMAKKGNKESLQLEIKVDTILLDNTINAGATQVSITQNTGIITKIRKRELTYLSNVSVGSISTSKAMWMEQVSEAGTPIFIGEGDSKIQLDAKWEEATADVKKIAVYVKVSNEMFADLPQLISYIEANMLRRMDIVIEDQLFNGDDTGDNLNGVCNVAAAFNAGALAGTIDAANEYDVIEAVIAQVRRAFGNANVFYLHPDDYAKMLLLKDANEQYIYPRWATADGLVVNGVRIIPTTAIAAGDFVGGDFTVVNVLNRSEMGFTIGLDGNDFTKNLKTILLERRLVQFVSANDTALLVCDNFADAKTDLLPT